MLVDPNSPERTIEGIAFPNQNHKATKAMLEGTLERKSRNKLSLSGWSSGYYVITPSKYLHEFKDNDNLRRDPTPELSIYLPDATIGSPNGEKFNIKGKDMSGGIGSKLSGSSEISFKAHSASDAQKWFEVIRSVVGHAPANLASEPTSPVSPVQEKRVVSQPPQYAEGSGATAAATDEKHPAPLNTAHPAGVTGGETVASPATATPATATAPAAEHAPVSAVDHAAPAPAHAQAPVVEKI
jgi:hypothetical protein